MEERRGCKSNQDERVRRDPYKMEVLEPLLVYFPHLNQRENNESVQIGLEYLWGIAQKAENYFDKGRVTEVSTQMAGLMTHVYGKDEDWQMPLNIKVWVEQIRNSEMPSGKLTQKVGKLIDFLVNKKELYLDFING